MQAQVDIKHLSKSFGALRAVDDVTFSVHLGEVLGFLGPNGAGKSTTMKMVAGFLPPTGGTAVVSGFDVLEQPIEVKRRIGYLPEGAPSYGEMTPATYLDFIAEVRGLRGSDRDRAVGRAMERVQLREVVNQRIETLSKGFKRRVGLAQAILHDPEVLILDEPTDGLDPNQKHDVRELIRDMAADKVIILSTHILEEVAAVCTRAIIIAHGRVLADAKPEELSPDPTKFDEVFRRITTGEGTTGGSPGAPKPPPGMDGHASDGKGGGMGGAPGDTRDEPDVSEKEGAPA